MSRRMLIVAGLVGSAALVGSVWFSDPRIAEAKEAETQKKAVIVPTDLDPRKLSGVDLAAMPPFIAPDDLISGKTNPRGALLFQGEELVAEVYEDDALKMRISEPFPHDEFILVLNGMLTVTDASGVARTYTSGDSLVLPIGFTGTWDTSANYRELVVVERKSYDATYSGE